MIISANAISNPITQLSANDHPKASVNSCQRRHICCDIYRCTFHLFPDTVSSPTETSPTVPQPEIYLWYDLCPNSTLLISGPILHPCDTVWDICLWHHVVAKGRPNCYWPHNGSIFADYNALFIRYGISLILCNPNLLTCGRGWVVNPWSQLPEDGFSVQFMGKLVLLSSVLDGVFGLVLFTGDSWHWSNLALMFESRRHNIRY